MGLVGGQGFIIRVLGEVDDGWVDGGVASTDVLDARASSTPLAPFGSRHSLRT